MFQITKEVETSQQPYRLHKAINMSIIDLFLAKKLVKAQLKKATIRNKYTTDRGRLLLINCDILRRRNLLPTPV